jgi:hypothetical protein
MARAKKWVYREDIERLARPDAVRELVQEVPGFDRKAFLAALIECFGGVERLAQSVYVEYQSADAGSMSKQRWGNLFCSLLSQESQQAEAARPAERLDDEELGATLLSLAAQAATRVGVKDDGGDSTA